MSDLQIIETRLDKLERMIAGLTPKGQKPNRFVNISEFAEYSGLKKNSVYVKLTNGEGIPGAFKQSPKRWLFDLDVWDAYLIDQKSKWN